MEETRIQGTEGRRGELRLFSVVSLWFLIASFLAPASLQGCEDYRSGLRSVTWAASVGVTGASVSADRAPGGSHPVPGGHDGTDGCCCPAPCSGCATGLTPGSPSVGPEDGVTARPGSDFHRAGEPVDSADPFLLPFAIPPPLSA